MLPEKPRTFKKFEIDTEYQSIFADGVTVSVEENDMVKLIFYENTYKFDPNSGYDKETKISRMKFEVRVSLTTLTKLSPIIFTAIQPSMVVDTVKIKGMHKLNPKTIKEIDKLGDVVIKKIFDTDDPIKYDNEIQDIFFSASERMLKDDEVKNEHK